MLFIEIFDSRGSECSIVMSSIAESIFATRTETSFITASARALANERNLDMACSAPAYCGAGCVSCFGTFLSVETCSSPSMANVRFGWPSSPLGWSSARILLLSAGNVVFPSTAGVALGFSVSQLGWSTLRIVLLMSVDEVASLSLAGVAASSFVRPLDLSDPWIRLSTEGRTMDHGSSRC